MVGVDFGALSGRAVVVRVADGSELASAVVEYPHAVLDARIPDIHGPFLDQLAYRDLWCDPARLAHALTPRQPSSTRGLACAHH